MTPPLMGTLLRMTGRGGEIKDNFNRSNTTGLGVTSTGSVPWEIITGAWTVNGTRPITSTSHSSNPVAGIDMGVPNSEVMLTLGAGDALYFRVQDSTNWWRALWEGYQTQSCQTCCSTCCSTCCDTCSTSQSCCNKSGPLAMSCSGCCCGPCANCSGGYCCGKDCGGCIGSGGDATCCTCTSGPFGSCNYSCNCVSCNCVSCNCVSCNCVYSDNYRMKLQKMIGGTLTTVSTGTVTTTTTTRAKVILSPGSNMQVFWGTSAQTSLYSGVQADLASKTKHGIGRGASSYNTSALDDFQLNWN